MYRIPLTLYRRFGAWLILPFFILSVLAGVGLTRLSFESDYGTIIPPSDEYKQFARGVDDRFGSGALVVAAVERENPDREVVTQADMDELLELTERSLAIEGTATVVGPANLQDLVLEADALIDRRLYDPADPDLDFLNERLWQTPLFRKVFISADGRALFTYMIPEADTDTTAHAERLVAALADTPVRLFGDSIVDYHITETSFREMILLGSLALVVVLIIQSLITKSLLGGLILSTVSVVPGLWTLALFPLFDDPVGTTNIVVPIIVMVLATSYGIHLYRYWVHTGYLMEPALERVAGVILAAGVTTVVGFLSLSATPSAFLRDLGFYIVAGTIAALACSLLLLPPILHAWRHRTAPARTRGGSDTTLSASRPAAGAATSDAAAPVSGPASGDGTHHAGYRTPFPGLRRAPRHPIRNLVIFAVLVVLVGSAAPLVRSRASYRDVFRDSHPVTQSVGYFQERTGTDHEVSLVMDSGAEYGLVSPELFGELKSWQEELPELAPGSFAISYVDLVEWLLGRLEGRVEPVTPETDADIGEALELLSGRRIGLSFESLVDTSWQTARVSLWVGIALRQEITGLGVGQSSSEAERVLSAIGESAEARIAGADTRLVGWPVLLVRRTVYMFRSQLLSLGLFAIFLLGFLLVLFRSVRWSLLAAVPTLVGVITYFGLMGWLGVLHDPMHVLMVCALLGVSNDDVLYFLLVYRRARRSHAYELAVQQTYHYTGVAIVQTTLIIAAGIAVLYSSAVHYLGWSALLLTLGLLAATATTLFVVPVLLRGLAVRERAGREETRPGETS